MAFAIGVETNMAHRKSAIWTQQRINSVKNTISCELKLKVIREVFQDR